jgi:hypothetical protein
MIALPKEKYFCRNIRDVKSGEKERKENTRKFIVLKFGGSSKRMTNEGVRFGKAVSIFIAAFTINVLGNVKCILLLHAIVL